MICICKTTIGQSQSAWIGPLRKPLGVRWQHVRPCTLSSHPPQQWPSAVLPYYPPLHTSAIARVLTRLRIRIKRICVPIEPVYRALAAVCCLFLLDPLHLAAVSHVSCL